MLGVSFGQILFFQLSTSLNSRQRRQSHHGPVSRHVCFGGKRSNGTDSSITFLPLVVKISLLLATFCFGVIYLVTNNIPSRIGLLPQYLDFGRLERGKYSLLYPGKRVISRFQNGCWNRFVVALPSCEICGHFRPFLDLFWSIFSTGKTSFVCWRNEWIVVG